MSQFFQRILALIAIACGGLSLAACDTASFTGPSEPTHQFVLQADLSKATTPEEQASAIDATIAVLEGRLTQLETPAHSIAHQGEGKILLSTIGYDSPQTVRAAIGQRGEFELLVVDQLSSSVDAMEGRVNPGSKLLPQANGDIPIAVKRLGGLYGDMIDEAAPGIDPYTNEPIVNIRFNERGAEKFAQMSTDNVGNPIAIVIDGVVVSAPIINEPILGGQVQISGAMTVEEANDLAVSLGSGALPLDLELVSERAILPEE